jgi:hypothetical protein
VCGYWLRCSGVLDFYYTKKGKRMSLKKVAVIGLLAQHDADRMWRDDDRREKT